MMKTFITALLIGCLPLSGCAGLTNDFASTNSAIAEANAAKYKAYTEGMKACGANAACQVGISMALATGAGDQKMIQPERTAEVLAAFVPFASLGLQAWQVFYGGYGGNSGNTQGYVVTGDNNTFSGIGNDVSASGESTVSAPFSSSNNFSWSTNNRDYNLGADTSGGGTVTDTGVDVDPVIPVE